MEHKRNPNYGKSKCFHCLSLERNDTIFVGINRLVVKGLRQDLNQDVPKSYTCSVSDSNIICCNIGLLLQELITIDLIMIIPCTSIAYESNNLDLIHDHLNV
jgi:hypothetical protein